MILILGHYPSRENEQDGMVQRIAAIDGLLSPFQRTYIATDKIFGRAHKIKSPLKWIRGKLRPKKLVISETVTVYRKIDEQTLAFLMDKAKVIYIHSLYFARGIPPQLLEKNGDKIFLDIHGCVVEENILMQAPVARIDELSRIEQHIFENIYHFIAVSKRMVDFYKTKYAIKGQFLILPIFNDQNQQKNSDAPKRASPTIIYSGGTQVWQNVELMVETIQATADKYVYLILTPQVEVFEKRLEKAPRTRLTIASVPKNDVAAHYKQADFGFVLRDDNIVNAVSCPTKIVEYIQHGIIPIVLQPEIGDFNAMGYRYILNETLAHGTLPTWEEAEQMREKNKLVMSKLATQQAAAKTSLLDTLEKMLGSAE